MEDNHSHLCNMLGIYIYRYLLMVDSFHVKILPHIVHIVDIKGTSPISTRNSFFGIGYAKLWP